MTPFQNIAIVAFVVTIFLWIWSFQCRLEQHENHIKKHDEEFEIASRLFQKGGTLFKLMEGRMTHIEKLVENKDGIIIGYDNKLTVNDNSEMKEEETQKELS